MELLVLLVVAVLTVAAVAAVVGLLVAGAVLALKVLPALLIGYVVVRLIQRAQSRGTALTCSDRAWLDTRA